MSSRIRTTGYDPEFHWVMAGGRHRLALVRRLSLSFELRGSENAPSMELWIHAQECIWRWRVSARALRDPDQGGGLAAEMEPRPTWVHASAGPPPWDRGRCVVEASSFAKVRELVERGAIAFALHGERVAGDYSLERTPLSLDGRARWLIRRRERAE